MPGVLVVWAWVLGIWFAVAMDAGRVDINRADAAALQELTMIGPGRAQSIVMYRRQHGPFQRIEDLMHVKGIGKAIVERNRQRITLEGREPSRDPAPGPAPVRSVPRR